MPTCSFHILHAKYSFIIFSFQSVIRRTFASGNIKFCGSDPKTLVINRITPMNIYRLDVRPQNYAGVKIIYVIKVTAFKVMQVKTGNA